MSNTTFPFCSLWTIVSGLCTEILRFAKLLTPLRDSIMMLDHVSGISGKRDLDGDAWIASEACCCCGYPICYYDQGPKCTAQGRQHYPSSAFLTNAIS